MHPLEAMWEGNGPCKVPRDTLPEAMIDEIAKCNPNDDGIKWVLGHGHSIESILKHIESGGRPPREVIDQVIPLNPVIIMEETSHSFWANSEALRLANIDKDTVNGPGGIIMKDQTTGEPNGILFENSGIEVMDLAMKSFGNLDSLNYDALLLGLEELRKFGVTSVCDARTYWKRGHHSAWKLACLDGELTVRAVLGLWAYPHMDDKEQIKKLKEMYVDNYYEDKCSLRINEIKVYSDGLLESTTAAMLKPYVKDLELPGLSANIGMNYFTQDRLQNYIEQLQSFGHDKGFDFHIHAIGDRGVNEVLNAIENAQDNDIDARHRMTHLEVVNSHDIGRFADLNVIADFQVTGEFTLPSQRYHIENVIGVQRAVNFIPVKSVLDTHARVTLSSDWDVSSLNPFISIQHAAQRGSQSVSVKSAIEMHTRNAAYAMRQENMVGMLAVGMEADFVILDTDPLHTDVDKIHKNMVWVTVLKGKIIYRLDRFYPTLKR